MRYLIRIVLSTALLSGVTACGGEPKAKEGEIIPIEVDTRYEMTATIPFGRLVAAAPSGQLIHMVRAKDGIRTPHGIQVTLENISEGQTMSLFWIAQGGIYPVMFLTQPAGVSTNAVRVMGSFDAGTLHIDESTGVAHATLSLDLVPEVSGETNTTSLPLFLRDIETNNLSLGLLYPEGLAALEDGWFVGAFAYFDAAAAEVAVTDERYSAVHFFRGLSRLLALGYDLRHDATASVDTLGDFFDQAGCPYTGLGRSNWGMAMQRCPETLDSSTPATGVAQEFLYIGVRDALEQTVEDFTRVGATFSLRWTIPWDNANYETDASDARIFRGFARLASGLLALQTAYDLNIAVAGRSRAPTMESIIANYPSFFTLAGVAAAVFDEARQSLSMGLADLAGAVQLIDNEVDDQSDDFWVLDPSEMAQTESQLLDIRQSLTAMTTINTQDGNPSNDFQLDLSLLLAAPGLDLRGLLPTFVGNTPGYFPDATMGGVLPQGELGGYNINEDMDFNGIPDVLQ